MTLRKLAATIFADIQGYSALMQKDETQALDFQEKFQNHIHNTVPENRGEVVQFYGDGCLMIFNSASDALSCARVLQDYFIREKIPVRIGLHIGDVVVKSDNVFGDSVNLASRIESMGVPGSILFSAAIADNVRNKSGVNIKSLGFHSFKNIEKPIEVFALEGYKIPDLSNLKGKFQEKEKSIKKTWIYVITALVLLSLFVWSMTRPGEHPENVNATSQLAIFPFQIIGNKDLGYLDLAIPEMLSNNLQNVGSINMVDPNLIIGAVGEGILVKDPIKGAFFAKELSASNFILGNLTSVGNRINLTATLYNQKGNQLSQKTVRAENTNEIPSLIDELSRLLLIDNFEAKNSDVLKTGALMTDNLESLRLFYQGESERKSYNMHEAVNYYRQALEKDSSFYLALYRLVYVEHGFFAIDGDYEDIVRLQNNLEKLPPKYKELSSALFDFLGHNSKECIRKYQYLSNSYRDDLEVNLMLGEAYFHYNKLLGKSELEALPYFEKVYKYDSLNQEAISHLIYLYILKEDYKSLEKFENMSAYIYSTGITSVLSKDSVAYDEAIKKVIAAQIPASGIIANNMLDDHLIEILDFLQDVRNIDPLPLDQFAVFLDHLARGHDEWVLNNAGSLIGPFFALFPVIIAPHPDIPGYKNSLAQIPAMLSGTEKMFDDFYFGSRANIIETICLVAISQDDMTTYNRELEKIENLGKSNADYEGYARFAKHFFRGIIDYRKGNVDQALRHFEALDDIRLSLEDDQSQFYTRALPRFMRAEILMKKGRYDEALGFLENYWTHPFNIVLLPWTYLRRAEIYALQGKNLLAIEYYNKFISLYETSDPQYQPFVENAREEKNKLIRELN